MNKLFLGLLAICGICRPAFAEEVIKDRFVNPLFYEVLEPFSQMSWENRLTPTSVTTINRDGYTLYQKCELVENVEELVSFHCNDEAEVMTDNEFTQVLTYVIKYFSDEHHGIMIQKLEGDIGRHYDGSENLIIPEKRLKKRRRGFVDLVD